MAGPVSRDARCDGPLTDDELDALFAPLAAFPCVVIAVSGGADSLALLHLYARWCGQAPGRASQRALPAAAAPPAALVATVDHRLRPQSALEAAFVADEAAALGLSHETLVWDSAKPATGLQAAAREARYRLLCARATAAPLAPCGIVTAHTLDDQAETLLMRLARGSGLDGLAGMAVVRPAASYPGVSIVRPLLSVPGSRLRATLRHLGRTWIEDPGNADARNERVRWRQGAGLLAGLGVTNTGLARSAARLARARDALDGATLALEASAVTIHPGVATGIDQARFQAAPLELRLRVMTRALARQGGSHPAPRLSEIERLVDRLPGEPGKLTLGGCIIACTRRTIEIVREPGRDGLPEVQLEPGGSSTWDNRFHVALDAAAPFGCTIRALCPAEWAAVRNALHAATAPALLNARRAISVRAPLTLPTFWAGGRLAALPPPFPGIDPAQRHALCSLPFAASLACLAAFRGLCHAEPAHGGRKA